MGAHHAREPLSTEFSIYVLDHIIENYGVDPVITENVNSKEIWFIPIVNPDGQKIVLDQTDTNWRKIYATTIITIRLPFLITDGVILMALI